MPLLASKHVPNAYNLLVVIFMALGTLSTAYGLAIIGSTVGQPNFYTYFDLATSDEPGYPHTTNIIGALNGVNSAGCIIGALYSAWSADFWGRKHTMQIGCAILTLGGALCSGSVSIGMFIGGRLVAGIGSGTLAVCVPMYQGEVATAETRGAMMCVTGIMYAFDSPHASFAWRFPLACQCIPPLVVLAGSKFIPYSPRWLLSKDRREEAYDIVRKLHATPNDPQHVGAKQEFYLIEKQFQLDKQYPHRFMEIFRTKANRRRSLVACVLMWGDQFLGIYVMTNYGVLIYAGLGLTGFKPLLLNACWTTFTIVGNTWTFFFVDKWGRRTFLLVGSIGVTVSLIFLCALSATYLGTTNQAGLSGAVFFVWFYILWWCFFIDATQYVYVSEIWPNALRSQGTALGIAMFFLASEITLVAAPVALNDIGWKFYLVLICPSVCYIVAQFFLFPETKGRTLEEIGALFGDEHIASHWYGISEEERNEIARNALKSVQTGHLSEQSHVQSPVNDVEEKGGSEMVEDAAKKV
ncbi:MFS transporter [Teratosphaeria nubilosa]|uniref:MFS transporter n=1 Tax=Teratosphaeria nubilosa TaxID=161662 RepID=A0A6G1LPC7_9PEZI|nr:MFS transporter [Teratosphaeria nubilosa]